MQVVCAGVKSVLDIPRTLEYLETQGVCVAAYGVDEFPAFFTRHSGCRAPCRMETPEQVAAAIEAGARLGLGSGMVLGARVAAAPAAGWQRVGAVGPGALHESGLFA